MLGVWAAPAGQKPLQPVAVQTPTIRDFRSAPKPTPIKDTRRLGSQIRGSDNDEICWGAQEDGTHMLKYKRHQAPGFRQLCVRSGC